MSNKLIVLYQPHQNLRQHDPVIQKGYRTCFKLADKVYWLPTFLSREKANLPILSPLEILEKVFGKSATKNKRQKTSKTKTEEKFEIVNLDQNLKFKLLEHIQQKDLVLCLGAGDIDTWVRQNLLDIL